MAVIIHLMFLAVATILVVDGAPKNVERKHSTCSDFSQGVKLNDNDVIGTWHMALFASQPLNKNGTAKNCLQFTTMTEQERKDLAERIGHYVENLKWETLTLKLHAPCDAMKTNATRNYYLEKVADDGSYRSFQIPPVTEKIDPAEIHRYPLRLKIIEGQYLGMMDCHEKIVFLMSRKPPQGNDIDEHLKKLIDIYAPEEF